ncbi:MAG: SpoIIE family protein phosphatase [Ignavibacteria bacterium]|nr:SpoIIE family protein phosphatase [Ignavibacteria bacterium]
MSGLHVWYVKNRMAVIKTISIIVLLLNLLSLYATLTIARMSNDECIWKVIMCQERGGAKKVNLLFGNIKPNGCTAQAGIKDNDRLLQINHIPVFSSFQAQEVLNKIPAGEPAIYTVQRDSTIFTTSVSIKKLVDYNSLGFGLFALIWFIIAYAIILAKPEGRNQSLFFKIGVLISISTSFPIIRPFLPGVATTPFFLIYYIGFVVSCCMWPIYYLRFFTVFPRPWLSYNKARWLKVLVFIAIFPAISSIGRYISALRTHEAGNGYLYSFSFDNYLAPVSVFIGLMVYAGFGLLLANYIKMKSKVDRSSIFIILVGYGLALIGYALYTFLFPALGYIKYNSPEFYTVIILLAIVPVSFGYAIFKYELMDVGYVVKNTISYAIATFMVAVLYIGVVYGLGNMVGFFVNQNYRDFVSAFFFILFALLLQRSKDYFLELLTRHFYPEQYAYRKELALFHQKLAGTAGREKLLNLFDSLLSNTLRVKKYAILLTDNDSHTFYYARYKGISIPHSRVFVHASSLKQLMQFRMEYNYQTQIDQPAFGEYFPKDADGFIENDIHTIIPLISGNNLPGFILLGVKHSGLQFDRGDQELLLSVSTQFALSLENARLYESEAERLKLERELELARNIQQNLLPGILPTDNRIDLYGKMIPALQIGGDYFDVIKKDDDNLFIVVGDVSGKGLPASLYMAKVQTLVQVECGLRNSPREILIEVNKRLYNVMDRRSFVTMSIAHFNFAEGVVRFCRAGHVPLILRQNNELIEIKSRGIGLALDKGPVFAASLVEEQIPLQQGQIYAFISDGISESMDSGMNCLGLEGLEKVISRSNGASCKEIAEKIWNTVTTHQQQQQQHDDMTLVLMKVLS